MANEAAKKNAKKWALWIKIIAAVTSLINLIFFYFSIYQNEQFGFWSWIGYIIIVVIYYISIKQILYSIAEGLPRPDMYWDALGTVWIIHVLWNFSNYFYWVVLWVPVYYLYQGYAKLKQMYSFMQPPTEETGNNAQKRKKRSKKGKRR